MGSGTRAAFVGKRLTDAGREREGRVTGVVRSSELYSLCVLLADLKLEEVKKERREREFRVDSRRRRNNG
jgi:hypothetical protein